MAPPGTFFCASCGQYLPLAQRGEKRRFHYRCLTCTRNAQAAQAHVTRRQQARRQALESPHAD